MAQAFIGLGSNLGDRAETLQSAVRALRRAGVVVESVSRSIETRPQGNPGQPDFLNGAAAVRTDLSARELLALLMQIEASHGRTRTEHWGPRTLDLDLLLYGREVIHEPGLDVPHPRMHERLFVLEPLAEIAPQAWHPVLRKTVRQLVENLKVAMAASV